ncbi:MAG: 50S ribosomal protein L22 [bacterium]|nr:50S ribosomal protein L22 [bacterium]
MTQATAKLQYLHMAPRKVRLVADVIRGLPVNEAEAQLLYHARRAAHPLLKLLRSASANAKVKNMDMDRLIVFSITVDQGPMLKRSLPRAMGRATPLQKKMSHVVLTLAESARTRVARFVMAKPEKPKKEAREHKAPKTPKTTAGTSSTSGKEKTGFLKRIFNRKSV